MVVFIFPEFYQKTSSVREIFVLKVFVINLGIIRIDILYNYYICNFTCVRPRSIYQYSSMAPTLSGQTSIFGVVFFVFKSLL